MILQQFNNLPYPFNVGLASLLFFYASFDPSSWLLFLFS